jgi:hypothetical protein
MDPVLLKNCSVYIMLRILKEENAFVDPDTLKGYPIIDEHIRILTSICPLGEEIYQSHFANNDAIKARFIKNPITQAAIKRYHARYIAAMGPMPPPPKWEDLSPNATPNFMKNLNKSRKSRRNRKGRKSRKN